MKNKLAIVLGIVSVLAIGLGIFFYDMGVDNKEISLRERFKAQEKICMTSHDNMWKVINQDAQVSDKYKEDFESAFSTIVDGMLSDDAMFQWLAGFNPELSVETYMELMKTIKDERSKFKNAQDICVDVSREYSTYIKTKPAKWFIDSEISDAKDLFLYTKEDVEEMTLPQETSEAYDILTYKPVTSTKTEDVFEKGVDDDVDLFGKNETTEKAKVITKDDMTEEEYAEFKAEYKELTRNSEIVSMIDKLNASENLSTEEKSMLDSLTLMVMNNPELYQ